MTDELVLVTGGTRFIAQHCILLLLKAGYRATLEQVIAGDQNAGPNVRSFVRKWRARHDSNVWPPPSENGISLVKNTAGALQEF